MIFGSSFSVCGLFESFLVPLHTFFPILNIFLTITLYQDSRSLPNIHGPSSRIRVISERFIECLLKKGRKFREYLRFISYSVRENRRLFVANTCSSRRLELSVSSLCGHSHNESLFALSRSRTAPVKLALSLSCVTRVCLLRARVLFGVVLRQRRFGFSPHAR